MAAPNQLTSRAGDTCQGADPPGGAARVPRVAGGKGHPVTGPRPNRRARLAIRPARAQLAPPERPRGHLSGRSRGRRPILSSIMLIAARPAPPSQSDHLFIHVPAALVGLVLFAARLVVVVNSAGQLASPSIGLPLGANRSGPRRPTGRLQMATTLGGSLPDLRQLPAALAPWAVQVAADGGLPVNSGAPLGQLESQARVALRSARRLASASPSSIPSRAGLLNIQMMINWPHRPLAAI